MSSGLRVAIDPAAVSMAAAIREATRIAPLFVLTGRTLGDVAAELGGTEAATGWLADLAGEIGHPLAVNFSTGAETSSTVLLAPRSWTAERLRGWAVGHREALEAAFGEVAEVAEVER